MVVFLRDMERNFLCNDMNNGLCNDMNNGLCNDMNNGLCNDMNNGFGIIRTDIPDRYSGQIFRTDIPDRYSGQIFRTDIPDRYSGQIFRTDIFNTTNLVYLYQEMSGTLCHRSEGFSSRIFIQPCISTFSTFQNYLFHIFYVCFFKGPGEKSF